jgi:dihydroorotate dehydrogenase electron transfer subunit
MVHTAVEAQGHAFQGTVLDLMEDRRHELLGKEPALYVCGPPGMLKGVARWARSEGIPCQVSLESPMACGVGVCLGCSVRASGDAEYLRVCQEGPVFDARAIDWEAWSGR